MFFRREPSLKSMVNSYFEAADKVVDLFEEAYRVFRLEGRSEHFERLDKEVHNAETVADEIRFSIEKRIYTRALLPESRDELLSLLNRFDKLPNIFETLSFMISTEQVSLPEEVRTEIDLLLKFNLDAYRLLRETVDAFLGKIDQVESRARAVGAKESESDVVEGQLIRKIFASKEIKCCSKILLREFVGMVGDISDSSERVAHYLDVLALSRKV